MAARSALDKLGGANATPAVAVARTRLAAETALRKTEALLAARLSPPACQPKHRSPVMRGLAALVVVRRLLAAIFTTAPVMSKSSARLADRHLGWVLLIAALVAGVVVWGVLSGAAALVRLPGNILRWRRERWRRIGERAATRGLIAIAAEDAAEARRQARRARRFLPDAPLTLLLSAQSAQLNHDGNAAHHAYAAMLDRPELTAAGLRGLLRDAVQTGGRDGVRLANALGCCSREARGSATRCCAGDGRPLAGGSAMLAGRRRSALSDEQARHRRGIILWVSREAETKGACARGQTGGAGANWRRNSLRSLSPRQLLLYWRAEGRG